MWYIWIEFMKSPHTLPAIGFGLLSFFVFILALVVKFFIPFSELSFFFTALYILIGFSLTSFLHVKCRKIEPITPQQKSFVRVSNLFLVLIFLLLVILGAVFSSGGEWSGLGVYVLGVFGMICFGVVVIIKGLVLAHKISKPLFFLYWVYFLGAIFIPHLFANL